MRPIQSLKKPLANGRLIDLQDIEMIVDILSELTDIYMDTFSFLPPLPIMKVVVNELGLLLDNLMILF